ncbi:hypothetical protein MBLNU459_g4983t2 [Dothideomycetes sp. NU459]
MQYLWLSLFAAIGSLALVSHAEPSRSQLTVKTTNGTITGHRACNQTEVLEFLGIPYAAPPIGSLRFAAPAPYTKNVSYIASNFSPSCPETPSKPVAYPNETAQGPRIVAAFSSQLNHTQSEDCLTLNIWTKPSAKSTNSSKPVLVLFYGGRWTIGDTSTPFYNGKYLADAEDVVVVTLNYRMNIFGFPGANGTARNAGLLDQRRAVEWLADNIAGFGGDPQKMVIFGQSAGSVAVDYYSYMHVQDPIVSGYISHSGNAFSFPTNNISLAEKNWHNASAILGCGSVGDVLACMRNQSWQDIKAAATQVKPPKSTNQARSQPAFQPTVDSETVFTSEEYAARLRAGNFSKLPYMFGNNDNEAGYYKIAAYAQGTILSDAAWTAFNQEDFTCPNTFEAFHRRANGVPTWLFRYFGDWDNLRLYPTSGAYHGSDLDMIFGTSEDVSGLPESANELRTQKYMMHAWATFAENPVSGLKKLGWPKYERNGKTLVQLALNESAAPVFGSPGAFDAPCADLDLSYWDLPA